MNLDMKLIYLSFLSIKITEQNGYTLVLSIQLL